MLTAVDEKYYKEKKSGHRGQSDVLDQPREMMGNTSSSKAMDLAARWLSYCLEHDKDCELPNWGFWPRRLIDVGSWDGSRQPFLSEASKPVVYACLSYCWGPDVEDVLRTTTHNLKSYCDVIPLSSMPPGIQDAVAVCRGLKIRYLWVDSLCIVQNDQAAWLEDASQMDRIYLHSHVTIAALEPESCKLRFLGKQRFGEPGRHARLLVDFPVETGPGPPPPFEVFLQPRSDHSVEFGTRHSLDKRGWCLQESLLPRRRLCFNGDEMIWECRCRKVCECGHVLWVPQSLQYGKLGESLKPKPSWMQKLLSFGNQWIGFGDLGDLSKEQDNERIFRHWRSEYQKPAYQLWRDLVSDYSRRSLSRRDDKLRAVSGLAKTVRNGLPGQNEVPDEYLAGCWRREFHFDLTWRVVQFVTEREPMPPNSRDRDGVYFRNPTWSWASVDGAVDYSFSEPLKTWKYEPELVDCIQVQSVSCLRELTDDETSAVISGRAILTGSRVPVELAVVHLHTNAWVNNKKLKRFVRRSEVLGADGSWAAFVRSQNLQSCGVFLDRPRHPTISTGDAQAACWTRGRCEDASCVWGKHHNGEQEREELYCFRLFSWQAFEHPMGPETWFLVLTPSSTMVGAFERIGISWMPHGEFCPLFEEAERVTIEVV